MQESFLSIYGYFKDYFGSSIMMMMLYGIALIWIVIQHKYYRRIIGIPAVILAVIIFNPWFYTKIWQKLMGYGYWRAFWLFPVAIIIPTAVVLVTRKNKYHILFVVILALLVVCNGKNVYKKGMFYQDTNNAFKLPQEAIDVADALLQLNEEPRAVVCDELYCYIRQYKSEIKLMYGRDWEGYIKKSSDDVYAVAWHVRYLQTADWNYISSEMKKKRYQYLVIPDSDDYEIDNLKKYGFLLIEQVDNYNIFYIK